ncbi:MAG: hypothetical protein IJM44_02155, partial [Ruminococcus sp.]|nr:hypothetical protein [Ruminococcus sp.]
TGEVVQTVTEPDGQPVTEYVTVTTQVAVAPVKQAATDGVYAQWIDISNKGDYKFEGDMMVATLKVKDDAPAGDYTIKVSTDFATYAGQSVYTSNNYAGTIRVGGGSIEADEHSSETDFIYYAKNVACNAGDEIQLYFTVKNNPGVVAFSNWFYYDTNVFEFEDLATCGEFAEVAKKTAVGTKPSN